MATYIPTLTSMGWINTIEEKGDAVLSYFITSEYSQSVLYHGSIASLQYLVKTYGADTQALQSNVQSTLDGLIRRHFGDDSVVNVNVVEPDPEKPGQLTITFRCVVRENGLEYSLGRRVEYLNSTLVRIAKINNG